MSKLDKYLISIESEEEGEDLGINLISFVKNPAIMVKGFAFNQQVKPLTFSTDEVKMRIIAPALIPMDIYRFDPEDGYEYEIEFTTDIIEKLWSKFKSNLNNRNVFNLEHSNEMVPAYMFQDWIVGSDPKKDKAYSDYGINVPTGSVMVISQITDKDYYNKLVQNEQYAFSIEGLFGLEELKLYANKKKKETLHDANLHDNCKCEIVNGELISNEDACDYCKEFELTKNKEQKMENILPEGERFQIKDKWYEIKDGKVVEVVEEEKDVAADEQKPEEEKVEEEMADEPVIEPIIEEPIVDKGGAIDEARLWELVQPKFDEILKMISDINVKISEDEDIESPVQDVQMNSHDIYKVMLNGFKNKK